MDTLAIAQNTFKLILLLALPSLFVSMVIGVIISIFQAVTQISDASLAFVPKLILVFVFMLLTLPWIGSIMETYTLDLWNGILSYGKYE
jgi:flagellar biosynthetic protein FliQ